MKIYSSSFKDYYDYMNLPIIKTIKEITKGGLYEEKENDSQSFKSIIFKDSEAN